MIAVGSVDIRHTSAVATIDVSVTGRADLPLKLQVSGIGGVAPDGHPNIAGGTIEVLE
ncbi:MAG: hypothetical protein ACYDGR_02785 [Candidatus Dormibacteria bacterium]